MPRVSNIKLLLDHDPGQNRQTFGERHTDQHRREDFAERAGVAADGHNAAGSSNADTDGRATECQTDVNITCDFSEHHMFFILVSVSRNRSPKGLPIANY